MYSYGKTQYEKNVTKNTVYSNIPKFMKIHVRKDDILNKIVTKFQKNSSIFCLQLNINDTKTVTSKFQAKSLKNRIEYSKFNEK